jgi:hypothetical protein
MENGKWKMLCVYLTLWLTGDVRTLGLGDKGQERNVP